MRRFALALLVLLLPALTGCGTEKHAARDDGTGYRSDTPAEDCYLCGGGIEAMAPWCWGQDNVALVSLNTFDVAPIEINRYDIASGQPIEEYAGAVAVGRIGGTDGGFSFSLMLEYDHGYADGSVEFREDEELNVSKAAAFLCEDCLNGILPPRAEQCFGVAVIDLATKETRVLEERLGGFGLGNFYVHCDPLGDDGGGRRMDLLIFYCPLRYGQTP